MKKRFSYPPKTVRGEISGELTVLDEGPIYLGKERHIRVRCNCGSEKVMREYEYVKNRERGQRCHACALRHAGVKRQLPKGYSAMTALMNSYRSGAKARGFDFELDRETFEKLVLMNCFYCNAAPARPQRCRKSQILVNGIDRFNSKEGYTKSNCVSCCQLCNRMKSNLNGIEFLEICKKITHFNVGKHGLK